MKHCPFLHSPAKLEEGEIHERSTLKRTRAERDGTSLHHNHRFSNQPTILIDGMNLCHARQGGTSPSARPLVHAIRYYECRGHRVLVILPDWAYYGGKDGTRSVMQVELLTPFVRDGIVNFAPSYTDDDDFCLMFARQRSNILILSNDNYAKYVSDGVISAEWRRRHVIKYMFMAGCFLPHDCARE